MKTARRRASHAKRQPRPLYNPIQLAMSSAAKFTSEQLATLMRPNNAALQALQYGSFDADHWRNLADAFNIAEALAKPPVNIANDHADKFADALAVLEALLNQYNAIKSWTARAQQLQTVKDAMEIFEIQLEHVAQGEFERAVEKLKRRMSEALLGNGGNVTLVEVMA